jgi:hypothetical protein
MATSNNEIETRLWAAADQLWANSDLNLSKAKEEIEAIRFAGFFPDEKIVSALMRH